MAERTCSAPGCDRGGKLTRGMCNRCYKRWQAETPPGERGPSPRQTRSFWDFVSVTHEHGCWIWTGKTDRKGYGRWSGGGVKALASRHSWTLAHGQIPDGMWVLHYCDMPPCVNPRHLYLGTIVENTIDTVTRGRNHVPMSVDHCPQGHEMTGDNLRLIRRSDGGDPIRRCRRCDNEKSAARQGRKRAATAIPRPKGLLSTDEIIDRFGIGHGRLFHWKRKGLITSQRWGLKAMWDPATVADLVASSPVLSKRGAA